jgi:hypothetical protein
MKKEILAFVVALLAFPTICFSQTSIVAPTNKTLTDASGNVWGFAGSDPAFLLDFYVTMNGQMVQAQGYSAGIFWSMSELLILNNGQLYATDDNYGGGAYQWNGATFNQIPSLPSVPPPTLTLTFNPQMPSVQDTVPHGTVIATVTAAWSDGSPFTGTLMFGSPYADDGGTFALSCQRCATANIVVSPTGLGLMGDGGTVQQITVVATQ